MIKQKHVFDVVYSIYEIHDPSKLKGIKKIVGAFKGRERDLISQLRQRYNISDQEMNNIVDLNAGSSSEEEDGGEGGDKFDMDEEAGDISYDDNPMHKKAVAGTAMKVVKPDGTVVYEYPNGQKTKRLSNLPEGPSLDTVEYGVGDADGISGSSRNKKKSRMASLYQSIRQTLAARGTSFYERSANVRSMFAVWGGLFFLIVSVGILVTVITVARQEQKQREARQEKLDSGD